MPEQITQQQLELMADIIGGMLGANLASVLPQPAPAKALLPSPFGPNFYKSGPRNLKVRVDKPQSPYQAAAHPKRSHTPGARVPDTTTPPPKPPEDQKSVLEQIEKEAQQYQGRGSSTELGHWVRTGNVEAPVLEQFQAAGVQDLDVLAALLNHEKVPENAVPLPTFHDDESPFVILSQPGKTLVEGGAPAVVVGPPYSGMVHTLEEAFPGVHFIKVDEVPNELRRAAVAPEKPIKTSQKSLLPSPFGPSFVKSEEPEPKEVSTTKPVPQAQPPQQPPPPQPLTGPQTPSAKPPTGDRPPKKESKKKPRVVDYASVGKEEPEPVVRPTQEGPTTGDPADVLQVGYESFAFPSHYDYATREEYAYRTAEKYYDYAVYLGLDPKKVYSVLGKQATDHWDRVTAEARKYRKDPLRQGKPIQERIEYYSKGPSEKVIAKLWTLGYNPELVRLGKEVEETGEALRQANMDMSIPHHEWEQIYRKHFLAKTELDKQKKEAEAKSRDVLAKHMNANAKWKALVSPEFAGAEEKEDPSWESLGSELGPQTFEEVKNSVLEGINFLRQVVSYGDMGEAVREVKVKPIPKEKGSDRAFFNPKRKDVHLHHQDPPKTFVHEFGHWLEESIPGVKKACQEFLEYRTKDDTIEHLKTVYPSSPFDEDEFGRKDGWDGLVECPHYIGKVYDGGFTEILSMGLELLYSNPVHFAKKDPEYFRFVLGVLDGSLRKY